mgnify:FL=1|tara:strand:+ start:1371 stop:1853 length:483 start_codon:yes stop_codon:yes gene_type:complete
MFGINRKYPVDKSSIKSSVVRRRDIVENKVIDRIKFKQKQKQKHEALTQEEIKFVKLLLSKPAILRLIMSYPQSLIKGGLFDVAHKVCDFYDINLDDLLGKKRDKHLVLARRDFCHICIKNTNSTQAKIGRFLKRDHTTVLHHLKHDPINIDKILENDGN